MHRPGGDVAVRAHRAVDGDGIGNTCRGVETDLAGNGWWSRLRRSPRPAPGREGWRPCRHLPPCRNCFRKLSLSQGRLKGPAIATTGTGDPHSGHGKALLVRWWRGYLFPPRPGRSMRLASAQRSFGGRAGAGSISKLRSVPMSLIRRQVSDQKIAAGGQIAERDRDKAPPR